MEAIIFILVIIGLGIVDTIYMEMRRKAYNKNKELHYRRTGRRLKEPFEPKGIF